jgi:DMSO reductase anchor subunit
MAAVFSAGVATRLAAAALAAVGLAGAMFHLGRPGAAWKAIRNLRRSWLSREVALLSAHAGVAVVAVAMPAATVPAALIGVAGVYASARLYIVPGRPAWNTPLTVVRFFATVAALGGAATGHIVAAVAGIAAALGATALNWRRLAARDERAWRGAVSLECSWLMSWTMTRWALGIAGAGLAVADAPAVTVVGLLGASELIGRWLFFVTVVPTNMPGAFWRGMPTGGRGRLARRQP